MQLQVNLVCKLKGSCYYIRNIFLFRRGTEFLIQVSNAGILRYPLVIFMKLSSRMWKNDERTGL